MYCYVDADLRYCGDMKILKTLFVIGVGIYFWKLLPIVIQCGCQRYRQTYLSLIYIMSVRHCLIIFETYFNLRVLSRKLLINLGIDNEKLKFVSKYTVYEGNDATIVVATSPRMNPTSNHITSKYNWFMHPIGK